jgi:hypothetical protein
MEFGLGDNGAGTNVYNAWDRFGRTVRHQWGSSDRFDYT